jgi:hypothetical protein
MRTKITIIFESYGSGTLAQRREWNEKLLEEIAEALELPDATLDGRYPLVTFDVVAVERLTEEP